MIVVNHYAIWPPIATTIFIKHCRVEIIAFPFMLFHRDRFFNVCCLFRRRFSATYLLKLFLLPQRVHTTLFIRCDNPELTCLRLCRLHAGIQLHSPNFAWRSCPIKWARGNCALKRSVATRPGPKKLSRAVADPSIESRRRTSSLCPPLTVKLPTLFLFFLGGEHPA